MLRAKGRTADGRPLIVMGLERGNIERLMAGRPISFDMRDQGIDGHCIIMFGETAEDCAAQFTPLPGLKVAGTA